MMPTLFWPMAGAVLLACGWLTSAWSYRRQITALQQQIDLLRRTAAEHAGQARRQIGQLQAELAARPPRPRDDRAAADVASDAGTANEKPSLPEDGFPRTVLVIGAPKNAEPAWLRG